MQGGLPIVSVSWAAPMVQLHTFVPALHRAGKNLGFCQDLKSIFRNAFLTSIVFRHRNVCLERVTMCLANRLHSPCKAFRRRSVDPLFLNGPTSKPPAGARRGYDWLAAARDSVVRSSLRTSRATARYDQIAPATQRANQAHRAQKKRSGPDSQMRGWAAGANGVL